MATLDVTDYGAQGDGETNDRGAIQSAFDDASSGDTVYFPAGTYAVEGSGRIFDLSDANPSVLTLEGDGRESVIMFNGGNSGSSSESVMLFRLEDHDEFTVRDLVIDGNRSAINGDPNAHITISTRGINASYTFEDMLVQGARDTGISMWHTGDVEANRVTVRDNGNHGMSFREEDAVDPGLRVRNSLLEENAQLHGGYYGIDAANGKCLIEDTVIRNNNGGATKTSHTGMVDTTYRRVRFDSNGGLVYLSTNGDQGAVTFENIVARNNGQGIRCSYIDYHFVGENVITGTGDTGMFQASDGQVVSADEIWANNNSGYGIYGSPISVDTLCAEDNADGPYSGGSDVGEVIEDRKTDLDDVPTADEVGAWSGDEDVDSDSDSETDLYHPPQPSANIMTTNGVIQTHGGTMTTAGIAGQISEVVVDDFEAYPVGTRLEETAGWMAAGSYTANHEVTDEAAAGGTQSLMVTGSTSYNAIQSTDGDGLNDYPAANCTLRIASYLEAGSHDIAFGVPSDEDNYHHNCYRLRGGPLLSQELNQNPSLIRTVGGEMETLVSFDNRFPTDTWLEHVIEFESTGDEVILTYQGYAWDQNNEAWTKFESDARGVDNDNALADEVGVGLGTYRLSDDVIRFDQFRFADLGETGIPSWEPTL